MNQLFEGISFSEHLLHLLVFHNVVLVQHFDCIFFAVQFVFGTEDLAIGSFSNYAHHIKVLYTYLCSSYCASSQRNVFACSQHRMIGKREDFVLLGH
mmetsp:Transcript_40270/g.38739  ORF Transcript_40270/g.38739 Transcript_40270/m.38739 type:complete len:97 (-) Transcript_40270:215-505(-)